MTDKLDGLIAAREIAQKRLDNIASHPSAFAQARYQLISHIGELNAEIAIAAERKSVEKGGDKIALMLEALDLAGGIMDFAKGDAYEREGTEKDRDRFTEIMAIIRPRMPVAEPSSGTGRPQDCPVCGKRLRNSYDPDNQMKSHLRDAHQMTVEQAVASPTPPKQPHGCPTDGASSYVEAGSSVRASMAEAIAKILELAEFIAALRAGPLGTFAEGIEAAAQWHFERRQGTPDAFEYEFHQVCGNSILGLAAPAKKG